jgi:hypothetical protein
MTPYFTKRIQTFSGFINFYFNRIYTVEGIRYHVSCMDTRRKTHAFNMVEMLDQWIIAHNCKCPAWIKNLEQDLEQAILESIT